MNQLFVDKMESGLNDLGINLSDRKMEQFYRYYELLTEWNKVMNLTAITELEEVVSKHFIDSLSLVRVADDLQENTERLIDVGTGAGFPGIPLKIAFPGLRITLLDSLNKRIKFLDEVTRVLELEEIVAVHGRAEDFGRNPQYREQFFCCVSRAVANAATLSEYCLPFVKVGGYFVAYKSGKIEEELEQGRRAVKMLGGEIQQTVHFHLASADADRALVVIRKKEKTPKRFPRKAGVPAKEPI